MSPHGNTMRALLATAGVRLRRGQAIPMRIPFSRNQLPVFCRSRGFLRGAEIGVWRGAFTAAFCKANPKLHMLAVDPWLNYPAWKDTKNDMPLEEAERLMAGSLAEAYARLTPLNCTIMRDFSHLAAAQVPDGSLDFAYIDGDHGYDAVLRDLTLWAPKVKSGGWVGGHDYRYFSNKPTIQVIPAVIDYTDEHAIEPWFVLAGDKTPSFLWVVQ